MDILSLTYEELEEYIVSLNEPKYRVGQIFSALHSGKKIDEISNISKLLKEKLKSNYGDTNLEIFSHKESNKTVKFLYKLHDDNIIEGVLMDYNHGKTLCVSTQVGCNMHCAFCASGIDGLIRNLSAGEILAQVIVVNKFLEGNIKNRKITNIVLMGSGEPLDNYNNVVQFLKNINNPNGINISYRNISLSTCGLAPKIYKLADEGIGVNLSLSLHASNDLLRKQLMPVANAYTISEVLDACKYYFEKTGRRFIIEYIMIDKINSNLQNAKELVKLLKGFVCHVNLISVNPIKEKSFFPPSKKQLYEFEKYLNNNGISATIRRTLGDEIDGACGQLRRKTLQTVGEK